MTDLPLEPSPARDDDRDEPCAYCADSAVSGRGGNISSSSKFTTGVSCKRKRSVSDGTPRYQKRTFWRLLVDLRQTAARLLGRGMSRLVALFQPRAIFRSDKNSRPHTRRQAGRVCAHCASGSERRWGGRSISQADRGRPVDWAAGRRRQSRRRGSGPFWW